MVNIADTEQVESVLEKKINDLQKRREKTTKLMKERQHLAEKLEELDKEIRELIGEEIEEGGGRGRRSRGGQEKEEDEGQQSRGRRGGLTNAISEVLEEADHPLSPGEIAEAVHMDPKKVRNLLYTSKRFRRAGRASFKVA